MTTHTIRDWRGNKTPIGRFSPDELVGILAESSATMTRIERFVSEVRAELNLRATSATR